MRRTLMLLAFAAALALMLSGCSDSSNPASSANQDQTPPAAPTGLTIHVKDADITVAWAANSEADLDEYEVYRTVNTEAETLLGNCTLSRLQDEAPDFMLCHLTYRVRAVDTSGNASAFSAPVEIVFDNMLPTPQTFGDPE
ncbi:MAG: hypothetical protein JW819_08260 [Candidatus Krumholzibacteriota bacterium]|nr:hypothetical protein [Candidatus Krumholzibacteriota bacterium]